MLFITQSVHQLGIVCRKVTFMCFELYGLNFQSVVFVDIFVRFVTV